MWETIPNISQTGADKKHICDTSNVIDRPYDKFVLKSTSEMGENCGFRWYITDNYFVDACLWCSSTSEEALVHNRLCYHHRRVVVTIHL
jgi:hypothetical protein